ncbi:MAG: hypothetical protein KC443_04730 [Anaerolineales bacterium]|nr:hypothetical protein [Anaerolineales bacterium]
MSQIIGSVEVTYNRQEKIWQAQNGQVLAVHPAGKEGKKAAIIAAIAHEQPQLAALAEAAAARWPELSSRLWKAAVNVVNGRMLPGQNQYVGEVARFESLTTDDIWVLQWFPDTGPCCSCPDHEEARAPIGPGGHRYCNHALTYLLHHKLQEAAHVS